MNEMELDVSLQEYSNSALGYVIDGDKQSTRRGPG
jgi:hypothetical protein